MIQETLKVLITAIVVVVVSEIAKRSSIWAGVLASLPLTSLLAFVWLYLDTGDTAKVTSLSHSIFWLVIPSLILFLLLPYFINLGVNFWASLILSCSATALAYYGMVWSLYRFGIHR